MTDLEHTIFTAFKLLKETKKKNVRFKHAVTIKDLRAICELLTFQSSNISPVETRSAQKRASSPKITAVQEAILNEIIQANEVGEYASTQNLYKTLNITPANLAKHIDVLVEKGFLYREHRNHKVYPLK